MLWTTLPDTFDTTAVMLLLDLVRGKPVNKRAAVLAGLNVLGYASDKFLPAGVGAAFQGFDRSTEVTIAETESLLLALQTDHVGVMSTNWAKIIAMILDILRRLFPDVSVEPQAK